MSHPRLRIFTLERRFAPTLTRHAADQKVAGNVGGTLPLPCRPRPPPPRPPYFVAEHFSIIGRFFAKRSMLRSSSEAAPKITLLFEPCLTWAVYRVLWRWRARSMTMGRLATNSPRAADQSRVRSTPPPQQPGSSIAPPHDGHGKYGVDECSERAPTHHRSVAKPGRGSRGGRGRKSGGASLV